MDTETKEFNVQPIICFSPDCVYNNSSLSAHCGIKHIALRKGICRHYKKIENNESLDRTDLGDGDFLKFIKNLH